MVKNLILLSLLMSICFPVFADGTFSRYEFHKDSLGIPIIFDTLTGEYCFKSSSMMWVCEDPFAYAYYQKKYDANFSKDLSQPTWIINKR